MPSIELLIPFLVTSAIFACVPGPGMLYAAGQTMALGRRAGWYSALGFHLAGSGHIAATALGITVLLQQLPELFVAMKMIGALYLIWLGVRYLRARTPLTLAGAVPRPPGKALRDSVVVEALNPKSALFFFAFLPQFTDPGAGLPVWAQIVILGAIVNAMFTATDLILIEGSHAVMRRLKASEAFTRLAQRIGGGVLIALGVNMALSRQ